MKECNALESNSTTAEVSLMKNIPMTTLELLGFLHNNMVDSPMSIVLPSSNRNRVGSRGRGRGRCSCSRLIQVWAQNGAPIGKMTFLYTSIALPFSLHWILSSLSPLNILISSSKSLEIVGALSDLTLWSRESLSNRLWPRLKQ
jgi:hypothetical protein